MKTSMQSQPGPDHRRMGAPSQWLPKTSKKLRLHLSFSCRSLLLCSFFVAEKWSVKWLKKRKVNQLSKNRLERGENKQGDQWRDFWKMWCKPVQKRWKAVESYRGWSKIVHAALVCMMDIYRRPVLSVIIPLLGCPSQFGDDPSDGDYWLVCSCGWRKWLEGAGFIIWVRRQPCGDESIRQIQAFIQ